MADGLLRWRRPLLIGVGVWLLSLPVLTWHPAAASHPVHVAPMAAWDAEAGDHRLVRELALEARAALEADRVLAAATTAAPRAAAAAVNPAGQAAPAIKAPPAPLAVRANSLVIQRL